MATEQLELEVVEEGMENTSEICTCCTSGSQRSA